MTFQRFVAIGDSFTEGFGDPDPRSPGGLRGWADRTAEVLATRTDDFAYANLAIRGRLLGRIVDEQIDPAVALQPDLITISAGGNDVIRPGTEPDAIAARLDPALGRLAATGATVVLFTGVDVAFSPVFRRIRGKVAIYNELLRGLAAKHGALVADQWSLKAIQRADFWSEDRLHLNAFGHHEVARMVLDVLGVPNDLAPSSPEPLPPRSWREARVEDLHWTREHLIPWIGRRIRGVSSGDTIAAKRPGFDRG
ncbi:SGNH/GDSL hydrolase family protein [Amnibacterium kyonggiense]|uniref:Lysophospholipase L1-like esterase n=1 Tax=Amnibacterium kyonggiense TaxID=595671 RepID=A0A4V3EAP2_9MICO|nr:SGNH/GDSL hydrolase family protein [Amnibacterium kyonggiense]TDS77344.1 lysophospholipase L1-like esterase [Amnibacterium kyonggiense]